MTDPAVTDANICAHNWATGAPPQPGGTLTYSQAARNTTEAVKNQAFSNYGLTNPHDGGKSYEVDHRIPLSLGGRDEIQNLWPETRTAPQYSAWVKDRLEFKLYNMVCSHQVTLADAQAAFKGDWTEAYQRYCPTDGECPAFGGGAAGN